MNWHAVLVVGALAACAGLLLYLPFFVWFRWRNAKQKQRVGGSIRVTRLGLCLYAAMLMVLFSGLAVGQVAPQSWFGAQVRTLFGGLGFASVVCAAACAIERFLIKRGFVFTYRLVPDQVQSSDAQNAKQV